MKRNVKLLLYIIVFSTHYNAVYSRTYEPPINFFFIIHVEPMDWGAGVSYEERMDNLNELMELASMYEPALPRFNILMNGDFAELIFSHNDSILFADFENDGHELGAHDHGKIRTAPFQWTYPELSCRYGQPVFNYESTHQSWSDVSTQLDRLTDNKHSVCASAFLCSNEAELAAEFGYTCTPGNRSEKCLDYTGQLMRHPLSPAANDLYGHELEEDLSSPIVYLDHYAQFGNEDAHGYNCTFDSMEQAALDCYQEWLQRESSDLDSLDYYVWNFGVLTHLWLLSDYHYDQIEQWFDFMDQTFINQYTPRGNLIGRYSTCWEIAGEYMEWKDSHPGWSSFDYTHPYPQNLKINEIMYLPEENNPAREWIEIFNPTESVYDLSGWSISNADIYTYWSIPEGIIEPGEYLVFANDGQVFFDTYGFYPDYEADGGTPALDLEGHGDMELHVISDAVVLKDTSTNASMSELNWVDAYSWGNSWNAGFCDTNVTDMGHSIGRDSNSTDTETLRDWEQDGLHAGNPTPGAQNRNYLYVNSPGAIPENFAFSGNYPNPFNTKTAFRFNQPQKGNVSVKVYNINGRLVKSQSWGEFNPGSHFVQLSISEFSSGVYPYIFKMGEVSVSGKMLYLK